MKLSSCALALVTLLAALSAGAQGSSPCAPGVNCSRQTAAGVEAVDLGPTDGHNKCSAGTREIRCKEDGTGYVYSFTVTNNTGDTVTSVLVTPPPGSVFTITPQNPPLPGGSLANGQSVTLQVTITGGQPGSTICFSVTQMTKKKTCCTVEICVDLPNCCAVVNEPKIECKPNGTYQYTFTITNKTPYTIQHVYLYPPTGVTITPSYFSVSLLPNATSQPLVVTISGAGAGKFCFDISLHSAGMKTCCTFEHCIELPKCGQQSACGPGVCCSRAPIYEGTRFTGQKIAAVTGWRNDPNAPPNNVLTVFDISGANGFSTGTNNTPLQYNGPPSSQWSRANLGSIFGVTIDHRGNIYVTASSVYTAYPSINQSQPPSDTYPGGAGRVFKINSGSGTIDTSFAPVLPNTSDPAIGGADAWPALGNISFDCPRKQFYVTNMDDGRIYRLDYAGTTVSTYDHATNTVTAGGLPEPGDAPGFAPLGERLWAVQAHNNRVYYSVWGKDCANRTSNFQNQIWSIGLTVLGEFDSADRRLELTVPDLPGTNFSNPTSDLSFSWDGRMLLSERTMGCSGSPSCNTPAASGTTSNAHAARVLEFTCARSKWTATPSITGFPYKYNVGEAPANWLCSLPNADQPANSAGGNDYDYDGSATYRVWATGDYLKSTNPRIYGLQGFPIGGGNAGVSPLIGLYGLGTFKTQIGDVEVSCPPGESPY